MVTPTLPSQTQALSIDAIDNIKTWATDAFERADLECQHRKERKEVQGNWLAVKTLSANILKTLGAPLPGVKVNPWRKVVSHKRYGLNGEVKNILECGHAKYFTGEVAQEALHSKKHRCAECGSTAQQHS